MLTTSLGVEIFGGITVPLIGQNASLPTRKSALFGTIKEVDGPVTCHILPSYYGFSPIDLPLSDLLAPPISHQRIVEIHVLQGEQIMSRDNVSLGKLTVPGIIPEPSNSIPEIEISFEVDVDNILHVSAKNIVIGEANHMAFPLLHTENTKPHHAKSKTWLWYRWYKRKRQKRYTFPEMKTFIVETQNYETDSDGMPVRKRGKLVPKPDSKHLTQRFLITFIDPETQEIVYLQGFTVEKTPDGRIAVIDSNVKGDPIYGKSTTHRWVERYEDYKDSPNGEIAERMILPILQAAKSQGYNRVIRIISVIENNMQAKHCKIIDRYIAYTLTHDNENGYLSEIVREEIRFEHS